MTTIRDLGRQDHALIGDIIADSFADDPVNLWSFNGAGAMKPTFTALAKHVYLPNGYGHVTEAGTGGTLWLPPGGAKDLPLLPSAGVAAACLRHGGPKAISRILTLDKLLKEKRPAAPHYYLFAIAVRPAHQGKGIGRKLMEAGLEAADDANMPCYLESSKESNLAFYRAFGFRVLTKIHSAPGAPPLWLMWRTVRA